MLRRLLRVDPLIAFLLVTMFAMGGVVAAVWTGRPRSDASATYYGVRLGMSPSQVRASFRDAAGGSWRREEAYRYELARWERSSANTSLPMYANFVFYDGLLTASQFKLDGEASLAHGPKTESTDFVDLTRVATPKGTVVLVARRCCALNESSDWAALKNQWLDG